VVRRGRAGRAELEAELHAFLEARWPALVRFGVLLTGDRGHAEDLVQSALERCWPKWRKITSDSPERYVKAAMANLAISHARLKRLPEVSVEPAEIVPAAASGADEYAVRDELWRALADLPPRMRAVVVLRWVEDLSESQTAHALGCSVGTVKSQSSRALARLRGALDPSGTPLSDSDRRTTASTNSQEG
jgi:RNA polymerase sigma-70 factor (sigma-E family)